MLCSCERCLFGLLKHWKKEQKQEKQNKNQNFYIFNRCSVPGLIYSDISGEPSPFFKVCQTVWREKNAMLYMSEKIIK